MGLQSSAFSAKADEGMSHEQYLARNNSASEMDEDDLQGDLNLSDDGSNQRDMIRAQNHVMRQA